MKPIGGIVTSKKSIPDNFRQVETFTTEYLSKLWKIYTINRDVLDKGRRLENLFWRIWGSERIDRTFSGRTVSAIFMMILEGEERFEQTRYRIPPHPIRAALPPQPIETLTTPRPSLEIQCPPTPPPSPIPPVTSVVGFQLSSSYLSKFPSETAITASLQQAFPDGPPSPPIPSARPETTPPLPEGVEIPDIDSSQLPESNLTVTIAANAQVGTVASERDTLPSPKRVRKPAKARKAKSESKPERLPRGRRKIVAKALNTKATTARVAAAKKMRPAMPKRKSSSSSNTVVNTAVSSPSNTLTVDVARSLPSSSQKQRQKNSSTSGGSEPEDSRRKGNLSGSGWVVDPDFRTKYLERKQKEKLVALGSIVPMAMTKTVPTTVVSEGVAMTSTKISRGKGKNVLVVDEIVPLKGLVEDVEDTQAAKSMIESGHDVEINELPSNLARRKSELTLLFEGERKAGEKSAGNRGRGSMTVTMEN